MMPLDRDAKSVLMLCTVKPENGSRFLKKDKALGRDCYTHNVCRRTKEKEDTKNKQGSKRNRFLDSPSIQFKLNLLPWTLSSSMVRSHCYGRHQGEKEYLLGLVR
mmetsp:Transcript_208/g.377  ORF Transcript_208/g.377 Transcript_208/m.377 type:complete len:105 (-) Transcript_208:1475-1789(-)